MQLFLHWLSHDLRRLRRELIVWTVLITGTAVLMGWIHLHVLTFDYSALRLGVWLSPILTGTMIYLTCRIFGSDFSGDLRAYWKTKPPSGYAVSASKLVLAGVFLLLLPMVAYAVVRAACVLPAFVQESSTGFTTGESLWTNLSALICIALFGTAAARDETNAALRGGLVALGIMAAALIGYIPALPLPWIAPATPVFRPWLILPATALALLVGTALFLAARRTRTPHPAITLFSLLLPMLVVRMSLAFFTEPPTVPEDNSFPVLAPETAAKIQISPPAPEQKPLRRVGGGFTETEAGALAIYQSDLRVSGLPANSVVFGRWLSLTLTAPDGRTVSIDPESSLRRSNLRRYNSGLPETVSGCEAVFKEESLAPFLGQRCTARGALRLVLITRHDALLNPWQTEVVENGLGRYLFFPDTAEENITPIPPWEAPWKFSELRGISRQPAPEIYWAAVHPKLGFQIGLTEGMITEDTSPFLQYRRPSVYLSVNFNGMRQAEAATYRKPFETTDKTDWRISQTWHEPAGRTDVSLVLENILVPKPGQ